jgi:Rhodopirellula transposase DDE domain
MEITEAVKATLNETQTRLSGYERRHFMAQIVETVFGGKPTHAEQQLGWNRTTLRKALAELAGGFCYLDRYSERGRKKAEERLPNLLADLRAIVDSQSQIDPTFRTQRLYTRLSAGAVRQQLLDQKGYAAQELPCTATINNKLNALGYHLRAVQKSRPQKNE